MPRSRPIEVLHVDDEPGFGELVEEFLTRADDSIRVTTALSADEGLDLLENTSVDCVVSDYQMPGRNGLEFLEAVREIDPELPFILFTGKGSEEIASEAVSAGVTDYLQKGGGTDRYEVLANRIVNVVTQHRAETQLHQSQERFRTIAEASPDIIFQTDRKGRFTYLSKAVTPVLGYSVDDLLDAHFSTIVAEESAEEATEAFSEAIDGATVSGIDIQIHREDGSISWLEINAVPIPESARDGALLGIARDVTDRKEYETALEESEEKFRSIFEESFDAIVLANDDGEYVDVNPAACELFGLPEEELIGRTIAEFAPPDFDFEAEWARFQRSDRDRGNFPLVTPDGSRKVVEYSATADVIPGRHLSILRDVTDRISYETRLERQVNQFQGFGDVISHDLRTPLATASARLELARETHEDEQFEAAEQALERLNTLIDDLAGVMREGEIVGDIQPTAVAECARAAWAGLESVEATLEIAADPVVLADRDALVRLFENLLKNAIEHAGDAVTIRVGRTPAGFFVEDDGPGIPPDEREEIFDPGYSTKHGGHGFGLVSIRQIALAHGWEVFVEEAASGGARFEFVNVAFADQDR